MFPAAAAATYENKQRITAHKPLQILSTHLVAQVEISPILSKGRCKHDKSLDNQSATLHCVLRGASLIVLNSLQCWLSHRFNFASPHCVLSSGSWCCGTKSRRRRSVFGGAKTASWLRRMVCEAITHVFSLPGRTVTLRLIRCGSSTNKSRRYCE